MQGFIDATGEIVIPCIYNIAADFEDGMSVVYDADLNCGIINLEGQLIAPMIYRNIEISNGIA